jgi:uncharacterized membrane protein/protein-disulfide isomerase
LSRIPLNERLPNFAGAAAIGGSADAGERTAERRLPYPAYAWTVVALGLVGLSVSTYLAVLHFRMHTDIVYQSLCAISKAINCDTVSQSSWSVLAGLPVAVWGMIGYAGLLLLAAAAIATPNAPHGWGLMFLASFGFSLGSVGFAAVSSFGVGAYCILCIATYAVNFALLFFTWLTRRRFPAGGVRQGIRRDIGFLNARRAVSFPAAAAFLIACAAAWSLIPPYWKFHPPRAEAAVPAGVTAEGHPWIGAEHPVFEITEFTDYQCFQCRKMHLYLRELVARYPEKIRLIHRNYPMDHEVNPIVKDAFHSGSGRMALLAIHGAASGAFWEINDRLFERGGGGGQIRLQDLAAETGIDQGLLSAALSHEPYRLHLLRDIREGMKLGIVGTPSYLIDGKLYEGTIPSEVLQEVIGGTEK